MDGSDRTVYLLSEDSWMKMTSTAEDFSLYQYSSTYFVAILSFINLKQLSY